MQFTPKKYYKERCHGFVSTGMLGLLALCTSVIIALQLINNVIEDQLGYIQEIHEHDVYQLSCNNLSELIYTWDPWYDDFQTQDISPWCAVNIRGKGSVRTERIFTEF